MIVALFFFGTVGLFFAWCVGMFRLWRGQPGLALWSAALSVVLGAVTLVIAFTADRHSDLLFAGMGHGDGMGIIGLIVFSAGAAAGSLVALLIAAVTFLLRSGRVNADGGNG